MIQLQDVSKTYTIARGHTVQAVRGVSLTVERGEFVVITGRSGSGKTTLLNLAAGLSRPTAGVVTLDSTNLWALTEKQRSLLHSRTFGFVFQFASLLPSLTVLENVVLPTLFRGESTPEAPAAPNAVGRARALLDSVGLTDKLDSYPRQLSAGQQQRIVIARALVNEPTILLADEPTSDLDEQTEEEIMDLFRDIHDHRGVTVILVTHARQLTRYGSRAIQMAAGQIIDRPPA